MAYPLERKDIEDYMNQGSEAYGNGLKITENPHGKFSQMGRLWARGWSNAAFGFKLKTTTENNGYTQRSIREP
jgi:hypothetical protein